MGRNRSLTDDQIQEILSQPTVSGKTLATSYGVSYVTILKVRQGKGAYAPVVPGSPVLDAHGVVQDVILNDNAQG